MKLLLLICLMISISFSETLIDFPLWGTNWIVAEGDNKGVYPSILPLQPDKIISLEFRAEKDSVIVEYANYNHRQYTGTSDVIRDFEEQIKENRVVVATEDINSEFGILNINYQPYDDTVSSLHSAILEELANDPQFLHVGMRIGTIDTVFYNRWEIEDHYKTENAWAMDNPTAYIARRSSPEDISKFSKSGYETSEDGIEYFFQGTEGITGRPIITDEIEQDYRTKKRATGEDITYIYIWNYEKRTKGLGYWQIHVHPEKWFFPVDIDNGLPIIADRYKKNFEEAQEEKNEYLKEKKKEDVIPDINLKYWTNPYLCDSSSVMSSFAFVAEPNIESREWVYLSGSSAGSKIEYEHYPDRMMRWSSTNWELDRLRQIRRLYTSIGEQDELAKTIDTRCPAWMYVDEKNGRELFRKKYIDSKLDYERDWNQKDNIFVYNNCPCAKMPDFNNRTKAELTKYIYYPIRTCSLTKMTRELALLGKLYNLLDAPKDKDIIISKIEALEEIVIKKKKLYGLDEYEKNHRILEQLENKLQLEQNTADRSIIINAINQLRDIQIAKSKQIQGIRTNEQNCPPTWVDSEEFKF